MVGLVRRKTVDTKLPTSQKRLWQEEEDELAAQEKEISFLQRKLENKSKLETLKATLAQDTPIISGTNAYSKGEMVLATVHGQDARIISFGWTRNIFVDNP